MNVLRLETLTEGAVIHGLHFLSKAFVILSISQCSYSSSPLPLPSPSSSPLSSLLKSSLLKHLPEIFLHCVEAPFVKRKEAGHNANPSQAPEGKEIKATKDDLNCMFEYLRSSAQCHCLQRGLSVALWHSSNGMECTKRNGCECHVYSVNVIFCWKRYDVSISFASLSIRDSFRNFL